MYAPPTVPSPLTRFLEDYAVRYRFLAYPISSRPEFWNCVYVFADRSGTPLYIGKASVLTDRISRHEKLFSAILMGAVELWVHTPGKNDYVFYEEAESRLINVYNPALNVQHRTGPAIGIGLPGSQMNALTGMGLFGLTRA